MKEVSFQSSNLSLHAPIALPHHQKQSFPGVILFHGMTSSEKSYIALASSLAEAGIAALAVSMRGPMVKVKKILTKLLLLRL